MKINELLCDYRIKFANASMWRERF